MLVESEASSLSPFGGDRLRPRPDVRSNVRPAVRHVRRKSQFCSGNHQFRPRHRRRQPPEARLRRGLRRPCQPGRRRPADRRVSARRSQLDRAIPLHNVAGNHDVGNEPTQESLAAYRRKFGPDYYVFRHADFLGIVLDSSLIQHPKGAPEEAEKQLQWLEAELRKITPGTRVAIFQHIPWFLKEPDEPDDYFNIPLGPRTRYLQLFEKYKVEYCFAGHYHRNSIGEAPTSTSPPRVPWENLWEPTHRASGSSRFTTGKWIRRTVFVVNCCD